MRLRAREFKEHWTSCWKDLKSGTPSLELAGGIRRELQMVADAVEEVEAAVPALAESLGLPSPVSLAQVAGLETVARHLSKAPGVPQTWLQRGVAMRLRGIADREAGIQETKRQLIEHLSGVFGNPLLDCDIAGLSARLVMTPEEERNLTTLFGERIAEHLVQGNQTTSTLRQIDNALRTCFSRGSESGEYLGLAPIELWTDLTRHLEIVQTLARVTPVPADWVEPRGTQVVVTAIEKARDSDQHLHELETRLFAEFEPEIVDVVDQALLVRYRTDHQSRLKRLIGSGYRADRKTIRGLQHRPNKMSLVE